jgi:hypothetical protein
VAALRHALKTLVICASGDLAQGRLRLSLLEFATFSR